MDVITLTYKVISVEEVSHAVTSKDCGAISIFVGITRDNFNGRKVVRLEYEAYADMAEKEIKNICGELREKWPDVVNIAVFHRLGLVPVSEASVVIAVSSPHRKDSLEAVHYCIDKLKATVPIWKKEFYEKPDEPGEWKANTECAWSHK